MYLVQMPLISEAWHPKSILSLSNSAQGARSLEEIANFAKSKELNCKATPLFSFTPLDRVIIDALQLFLCISDNMTELLIRKLRRDACEKATFPNGFSWEKFKHMARYEAFLKNLSISFEGRINKDTKKAGLQRFKWSRKTNCNAKHWLSFLFARWPK